MPLETRKGPLSPFSLQLLLVPVLRLHVGVPLDELPLSPEGLPLSHLWLPQLMREKPLAHVPLLVHTAPEQFQGGQVMLVRVLAVQGALAEQRGQ